MPWAPAMDRYEEALADLNRAIELDPGDASYYAARSQAYQAMGRNDQAGADFDRAQRTRPQLPAPCGLNAVADHLRPAGGRFGGNRPGGYSRSQGGCRPRHL